MTDLPTRSPTEPHPPSPRPPEAPDARTLRHAARAEQQRRTADADLDRRARAARLNLQLREQQRDADRRERRARADDRHTRTEQRRTRRATRRAARWATTLRWAERALFVLPIGFPMAVAWTGQIRFAMTVMSWPLPAAIVFAAGFELSTAYVARLDWRTRAAGDHALLFRAATWAFATGAAVMNYWHAAGPALTPTGEAVSYAMMSITGIMLWELWSTYRHRTTLRAEGKLPAARPRFGTARWIWFANPTSVAWLLALRDGYPTTDLAWQAATTAVHTHGSPRAARKAIRAGHPIPHPEPADDVPDHRRDHGHSVPSRARRDTTTRDHDRRDETPARQRTTSRPGTVPAARAEHGTVTGQAGDAPTGTPGATAPDTGPDTAANDGALSARMQAYARARLADGTTLTGADLDRQFGTRDYGRKVLRRLATSTADQPPPPNGVPRHARAPRDSADDGTPQRVG